MDSGDTGAGWLRSRLLIFASLLVLAATLGSVLTPRPAAAQYWGDWSPPNTVYIPETGQSIDGLFLDFWRSWGGVGAFGNPITPEIDESNGRIVQYYDFARFEYVPNDPQGNLVQLGRIGEELRPTSIARGTVVSPSGTAVSRDQAGEMVAWAPLDESSIAKLDPAVQRYVPESGHTVRYGFRDFWEQTGEAGYLGNPVTEEYSLSGVTYQVFEHGQLAWKPGELVWMVPVGDTLARKYNLDTSPQPQGDLPLYSESLFIPPEIWIDVNLSEQYMTVFAGGDVIAGTYVSTGRPGFDTPPGTFYINTKLESQTMSGVIGGESYNVPDVPWVMYFTDEGHAIHGTYWHSNFGAVMSHGCVNLPMDFAAWLYGLAPIGTRVEIHY